MPGFGIKQAQQRRGQVGIVEHGRTLFHGGGFDQGENGESSPTERLERRPSLRLVAVDTPGRVDKV